MLNYRLDHQAGLTFAALADPSRRGPRVYPAFKRFKGTGRGPKLGWQVAQSDERPRAGVTRRLIMLAGPDTDSIERRIRIEQPRDRVWQGLVNADVFGTWFGADLAGQSFVPGQRVRWAISCNVLPPPVSPTIV